MKIRSGLRGRTNFITGLAGLAAIVSGVNCNNHLKPLEGDVSGLPAENVFFDRAHMEVFEEDAQKPEGFVIPLGTDHRYDGTVNFDSVEILSEANGRAPPYSASLVTTNDENGNETQEIVIRDNNNTFVSGETWSIRVYGDG